MKNIVTNVTISLYVIRLQILNIYIFMSVIKERDLWMLLIKNYNKHSTLVVSLLQLTSVFLYRE